MFIPEPEIYDFIFPQSPEAEIEENARLLLAFEPLIQGCVNYAVQRLSHENRAVLMAEARFGFLLLLEKFEAEKGVPLAAYLVKQLRFYIFNYCRAEQARLQSAACFEEVDFEPVVFAEWASQSNCCRSEIGAALMREVELLTEKQKLVMQGVAAGLSEREIGARLGISGVRVHQLKEAAKAKLKKKLEDFDDCP